MNQRIVMLAALLLLSPVRVDDEQGKKIWERKLGEEVIAVVNADSVRVTLREPGEEAISTPSMTTALQPPGQGLFEILGTPQSVALLAVRDRNPYVQLVALSTVTGDELWRVPCTDLPAAELADTAAQRVIRVLSDFIADRSQVIVVQRPGVGQPNQSAGKALIAYDIKTGAERWRSSAPGIDMAEMLKQFTPETKGLSGRFVRNAMKNVEATMSPTAAYFTLPERNALLKVSGDLQAGVTFEAVDLDTGAATWSVSASPPSVVPSRIDPSRIMKSQGMQAKLESMQQDPAFSARLIARRFRGGLFFPDACTGEAVEGAAPCASDSLRAYSVTTGQMAWEFREPSQQVTGYLAGPETVLARLPGKIAVLKLATGEKVSEIDGSHMAAVVPAFGRRTYADGNWVFWADQRGKSRTLVALDATKGTVVWEAPVGSDSVVGLVARDATMVVAAGNEIVLLDKASGRELGREKALGGGPIRSLQPLDSQSVMVLGDEQVSRFGTDPWKRVYTTTIPRPKESAAGLVLEMVATFAIAYVSAMPVSLPGGTQIPYGLTPQGMWVNNLLPSPNLPAAAGAKVAQRSSRSCYFTSGDTIHRIDVLTGTSDEMASTPKEDSVLAVDESRGIACHIRHGTVIAYQLPVDDNARRQAEYGDGLEVGATAMRRAEKLETTDKAGAAAAYAAARQALTAALAAAADPAEKALVNLALGRAADRLAALRPGESQSWRERSVAEYTAAANLACNRPGSELEKLCQAATERLRVKTPQVNGPAAPNK